MVSEKNETIEEGLKNEQKEQNKIIQKDNSFVIYPNPTTGEFWLTIPLKKGDTALVYVQDILGRMIYNSEISHPQSEIDISSHPKGIYFVTVIQGNNITRKKIVLQ